MRDREEALHSYVTDMLALEEHIQKAVGSQLEDLDDERPEVIHQLRYVLSHVEQHIGELRLVEERLGTGGGGIGEAVKRAGSMVAGLGAAAIDLLRSEKLPKNLRDDYTAASLAYIGYVMLYTTASSFEDEGTAQLASQCVDDYAQILTVLQDLIPAAVVFQLRTEGFNVAEEAAAEANARTEGAWQGSSENM